jgi:hypothetical protein
MGSFIGNAITGADVGLSFVAGPAGYAISAAGTSDWLCEALRELERDGRNALASMGVSDAIMNAFYADAILSPTDKAVKGPGLGVLNAEKFLDLFGLPVLLDQVASLFIGDDLDAFTAALTALADRLRPTTQGAALASYKPTAFAGAVEMGALIAKIVVMKIVRRNVADEGCGFCIVAFAVDDSQHRKSPLGASLHRVRGRDSPSVKPSQPLNPVARGSWTGVKQARAVCPVFSLPMFEN